jgi:hypothetical protein
MKSFEAERGPHRATSWPQPLVDEVLGGLLRGALEQHRRQLRIGRRRVIEPARLVPELEAQRAVGEIVA